MSQVYSPPPFEAYGQSVPFGHAATYGAAAYAAAAYGAHQTQAQQRPARSALGSLALSRKVAKAYTLLWLQPGAPEPVVKAAYRALAAKYHPDAGGDAQAMIALNQAYETILEHLKR